MIIVKDKAKNSPLFIPRNTITTITNTNNSGGGNGIDVDELNKYLADYVTEEELKNKNYATITALSNKQDKLVSGDNIKTINGQSILGEGNITIEGGNGNGNTNIVELTQDEYDNLEEKDENTIYVITDAPAIDTPDTSIFITESELLEMGYATQGYVDEKLGDIETILNNIIGQE